MEQREVLLFLPGYNKFQMCSVQGNDGVSNVFFISPIHLSSHKIFQLVANIIRYNEIKIYLKICFGARDRTFLNLWKDLSPCFTSTFSYNSLPSHLLASRSRDRAPSRVR